ncbi:hypothetical protein OH77DRAFT_1416401 [Trametes cingulata]|nr:hypothetical protein OH77DRAFT_1416401 [Trametes cingulata]
MSVSALLRVGWIQNAGRYRRSYAPDGSRLPDPKSFWLYSSRVGKRVPAIRLAFRHVSRGRGRTTVRCLTSDGMFSSNGGLQKQPMTQSAQTIAPRSGLTNARERSRTTGRTHRDS